MNILIAGDLCPRYRGAYIMESEEILKSAFEEVRDIVNQSDYSIVNLECPVVSSAAKPILKMGPNLCCSENVGDLLDYIGFKCVTLANNHIMDYGKQGLIDTMDFCRKRHIDYMGVGLSECEASSTFYKKIDNKTIAIINCCEQEFSIASGDNAGAAHLEPVAIYYRINNAQNKADRVIVIVHGGHEHWQLPSPRMVDLYRFFIDAGADVVVNHHQHCYSGYERYKDGLIFYGLGNFFFDSKPIKVDSLWNYGYMVTLSFEDDISFEIIPYSQCDNYCGITLLQREKFNDRFDELNGIIADRKALERETNQYYAKESRECALAFEPVQNRYVLGLQFRKILPLFKTKKSLLRLYNFVLCESHRDKVKWYLTNKINNQ